MCKVELTTVCISVAAMFLFMISSARSQDQDDDHPHTTAERIMLEATRPNHSPAGRPLPLAAHWTSGAHPMSADFCGLWMELLDAGHHVLPWFDLAGRVPAGRPSYEEQMKKAAELNLPIVIIGSQWESRLSRDPYYSLPPEENPNVVTAAGEVQRRVSPFGPLEHWRQAGRETVKEREWLEQAQQWYPAPPLVIFLSNNEHAKLRWHQLTESKRYLDRYDDFEAHTDDFKRTIVGDAWIERYRALQDGMRAELANPQWRDKTIFVGYDAFGPPHFGRWGGWLVHSQYKPHRIDPNPLMWDGGSPSYYTDDWNARKDHTTWSPQVEFMNLVFMLEEAHQLNPDFFFEFSVWDGYHNDAGRAEKYKSKRSVYREAGQEYNPERYGGFVQYGMWLLRPRAVRDFRGWIHPLDGSRNEAGDWHWEPARPYFMAIVEAVDRVHNNAVLREWWRNGALVPNRARSHPYQANIPAEYADRDRWFLLDADVNPESFGLADNIPVFALALKQGQPSARRWLLYGHSPLQDREGVAITVPDYGTVSVDITVAGSFYVVHEDSGLIVPVDGGIEAK